MHSHTYSGNPLGCSAALAVQKILREDNVLAKANETAVYLHDSLQNALGDYKYTGEIRHIGLINAIELVKDKDTKEPFDAKARVGYQIYKKALTKGLLLRPLGDVLYFNPPLNIERQTLNKAVQLCTEAIKEILD